MAGAKIEKTQTQQAYNIIILIRIKLEYSKYIIISSNPSIINNKLEVTDVKDSSLFSPATDY
jgi:hypothetical protein